MNITQRKPFTPGEILREEFMQPYSLTQEALASLIGVTRRKINEIVTGKRAITPDIACRLARLFNMTPEFWLNLQIKMELWEEMNDRKKNREFDEIKPLPLQR